MPRSETTRRWLDVVPQEQREIIAASGLGQRAGLGRRPAVLIVDVTYGFTGDRPAPVRESIERFPLSCGTAAWDALPRLAELVSTARERAVPVIYTCQATRRTDVGAGRWGAKNARLRAAEARTLGGHERVHELIAPAPDEIVIVKDKPSAFFGTALVSVLHALDVDSLIIAGTATSGCVRATAVDAFSYNYPLVVVEECTFDRIALSHDVALFEIDSKYGDVVGLGEICQTICRTTAG